MKEALAKYLPPVAVDPVMFLIKENRIHLKIVNERKSRHGDYRRLPGGVHQITINSNLNPYRFLMTLIHEIAHLKAFEFYGRNIKPHGPEWKYTFRNLMLPLLRPDVFPEDLLPYLARHFRNPYATSDTDARLSLALKSYDPPNDLNYVFEIPHGTLFKMYNGRVFKKGKKRVKLYECLEVETGRVFLFQPNAEVKVLQVNQRAGMNRL